MKKIINFTLIALLISFCSSGPERDYSGECGEVKKAYDDVFRAYAKIQSDSLPNLSGGVSVFEWSSLFNDALRQNPTYKEVTIAIDNFDTLLISNPNCESELN